MTHVKAAFNVERELETLRIRIHHAPRYSNKGWYEDLQLEGLVSITRLLDREYTRKAKDVRIDVDLLVFDAYLAGYEAMPLDLCFGSRLPPVEQPGLTVREM